MASGIYFIKSPSGKMYVGSAVNIKQRLSVHLTRLRTKKHPSMRLSGAWAKYKGEGFETGVLEECPPEKLAEREQHWMELLKPGYNVRFDNVQTNLGLKGTKKQRDAASRNANRPEHLAMLAEAQKAAWADPDKRAARVAAMKAAWTPEKRVAASERGKGQGPALLEARWSKPGASERASEALKASWANRLPRTEEALRAAVEAAGWVCEGTTGVKASDRITIFCAKHDYRKEIGVRNLQRGQGCRHCGFERSSAKQSGVSVPARWDNRGYGRT